MITPRRLEVYKRTARELRQAYENGVADTNPGFSALVIGCLCVEIERLQKFKRRAQKREQGSKANGLQVKD